MIEDYLHSLTSESELILQYPAHRYIERHLAVLSHSSRWHCLMFGTYVLLYPKSQHTNERLYQTVYATAHVHSAHIIPVDDFCDSVVKAAVQCKWPDADAF